MNYTTTVEGSTATYQCGTGLIPEGVITAVCMENGEWAPDTAEVECRLPGQGMCAVICQHLKYLSATCGVPPSPSNGFVDFTTLIEGTVATFRCDSGPEMTAVCTTSGVWVPNPGNLSCDTGRPSISLIPRPLLYSVAQR